MSAREDLKHKIKLNRPLRVNITYDVETWCFQERELPFIVGVLGDFVGNPEDVLPKFRDRKFIEIEEDNFNQVIAALKPRLVYSVENKLQEDANQLGVELKFNSFEDFEVFNIVQQVEPLRELVEARKKLSDLRSKLKGNERLKTMLEDIVFSPDKQKQLSDALGIQIEKKEE